MGLTPNSNRLYPEVLRTIDSATFTGSYQALGTPLVNPSVILKIYNGATVAITISWDGSTDHEYLPTGAFLLFDVSANSELSKIRNIAAKTQFYVKGSAGAGLVYLSSYYAR